MVGRAQRPAERLGESDIARVVGRDVRPQLESSAQQPEHRVPDDWEVGEVVDGLPEPLVGDDVGQPSSPKNSGRLGIDQIRRGELSLGAQQVAGLPAGLLIVADRIGEH